MSQVCTYPTLFRPGALYAHSGIRASQRVSTGRARPNSRPLARPRPDERSADPITAWVPPVLPSG